mgnify:CR=1 FL=1
MRREIDLGDRKLTLVGTAHISEESKREVRDTIEDVDPDHVFVELDQDRYESLRQESGWRDTDLMEAIRGGKGFLLASTLIFSIYQRRMGLGQDIKPGEELLEAVDVAEERDVPFSLVDQSIDETFGKTWKAFSLVEKLKLPSFLFAAGEEMDVEELKQESMIDSLTQELGAEFPAVKKAFIDDRNRRMAEEILDTDFSSGVAVVGAAHVSGLENQILEGTDEVFEPSGSTVPWMKVTKYGLPAFIVGSLGYVFMTCGVTQGFTMARNAFLVNAVLPFIGALIARASPLTAVTSFFAAPFTSLDPALGAGMVAAYVEGKFNPPTVQELEDVVKLEGYRDLWGNQAGKILLVFLFVTLGSAIATVLAAVYLGIGLTC